MRRKEFLKGAGLAGLGLALPWTRLSARPRHHNGLLEECVLIPNETPGPFPLDLTENNFFFRQDVRENEEGVPLRLRLKIIGSDNCLPMPNVRVNIWHCSAEGWYSGYDVSGNPGQEDLTYLRGYQFADAQGEVEFLTILPGWYNGRICHIHFQVYVSSNYAAISQLTFPVAFKNEVYAANQALYPKGEDPLTFAQDFVFADGHEYQLATLEEDPISGELQSFLEVTVQGAGVTSIGHIERETAKVFTLGQNVPNPYTDMTTIPFTLKQPADVRLTLWDLSGREVATIMEDKRGAGSYHVKVRPASFGLSSGSYIYQLEARTTEGIYRLPMMMTAG